MRRGLLGSALGITLALLAVLLVPSAGQAAGTCATYKTYITGDSFGPGDINSIQVLLGQTNMTWACLDDYSTSAAQMQETRNPYPSDAVSLATTGQEELTGLRHVIKQLTGWSQWYTHTEGIARAQTWNTAATNFCAFCVNITDTLSHDDARFADFSIVSGGANISKFRVRKDGNTTIAGTLAVTGASTLTGNVTASGTLAVTGAVTLSTALPVTGGGTGLGTLAANRVLYASALDTAAQLGAMTNGQLIVGSTGAAPSLATLTAGSNVTITNAAGSITVASTAGGAVTSVGSDLVERTTTSTTTVDLSTITVTSIPTTSGIQIWVPWRRTSGAASAVRIGLKFNTTTYVGPAAITGNTNQADEGTLVFTIPPRDDTYGAGHVGPNDPAESFALAYAWLTTNDRPNAAITSVVITASVVDALNTIGIKNVLVFAVAP